MPYQFETEEEIVGYVHKFCSSIVPEDIFDDGDLVDWAYSNGYVHEDRYSIEDAWLNTTDKVREAVVSEWIDAYGVPAGVSSVGIPTQQDIEVYHDENRHLGPVQFCGHPYCQQYREAR